MKREAAELLEAPEWDKRRAEAILAALPDEWAVVGAMPIMACPHAIQEHGCVGEYVGPGWVFYGGELVGDRYAAIVADFEEMENPDAREAYLAKVRYSLREALA